jgi:hypothetical protein
MVAQVTAKLADTQLELDRTAASMRDELASGAAASVEQEQHLQHLHAQLEEQKSRRQVLCRQAITRWLGYSSGSTLSSAWVEFKSHLAAARRERDAAAASAANDDVRGELEQRSRELERERAAWQAESSRLSAAVDALQVRP